MNESGVVGLVPAAGWAKRLGGLEASKEVLSIPDAAGGQRPVAGVLLEAFAHAGIESALVLLRHGKWDVVNRLGGCWRERLRLGYLVTPGTSSVVESVDLAYDVARHAEVLLGFPDCLFEPRDAAERLRSHRVSSSAAATLALFPSSRPDKTDMVDVDADGRVRRLEVRPGAGTRLTWTWLLAGWGGEITELIHELAVPDRRGGEPMPASMSLAFAAAIDRGLEVDSIFFPEGRFLDIGTPEDLDRARRLS